MNCATTITLYSPFPVLLLHPYVICFDSQEQEQSLQFHWKVKGNKTCSSITNHGYLIGILEGFYIKRFLEWQVHLCSVPGYTWDELVFGQYDTFYQHYYLSSGQEKPRDNV